MLWCQIGIMLITLQFKQCEQCNRNKDRAQCIPSGGSYYQMSFISQPICHGCNYNTVIPIITLRLTSLETLTQAIKMDDQSFCQDKKNHTTLGLCSCGFIYHLICQPFGCIYLPGSSYKTYTSISASSIVDTQKEQLRPMWFCSHQTVHNIHLLVG